MKKSKETFRQKLLSPIIWVNIAAMIVVIIAICLGVKYGLREYTHHGESITVPDINGMSFAKAKIAIQEQELRIEVSDSGYNKALSPGAVLAQVPVAGSKVKQGHVIYVTLNASRTPTLQIPDVIDNSSAREARARLTAMGFQLLDDKPVSGERDWVYGITCRGREVRTGEKISIETPLQLLVGSGAYEEDDVDIDFGTSGSSGGDMYEGIYEGEDEFIEMTDGQ